MIDFKTVMGGLAICTIGYSIKLGWGLRKDLTGTSDGAVVVKSDASGKKYVVGEVQMAAPDAERQTTLIELSKLWKDKKDPDNKQDDPKLIKPPSDMSATVQMTTLATMWEQEQANPGKAIDLQLPPFTRQ